MPIQTIDWRRSPLPDINRGAPVGRGFLFNLDYEGSVNLAIGDDLRCNIAVPNDEHWYVLQWECRDRTDPTAPGIPNGFESQSMNLLFDRFVSPVHSPGVPDPAAWNEISTLAAGLAVWNRWWDGVTPIYWGDWGLLGLAPQEAPLKIRCTDPVWSVCRWPPSMQAQIISTGAQVASGGLQGFDLELVVIRYRTPVEDLKRLRNAGASDGEILLEDTHLARHQVKLGE